MTIKAIVAIGNQGQVGLNGRLPWDDPEDLKWFREQTMGKVCVVGWRTAQTLPKLPGRIIVVDDNIKIEPAFILLDASIPDETIIIGGPKTYARWNHLVDEWLVSRVNYTGDADVWFNFDLLDGKKVTYRNEGLNYDPRAIRGGEQAAKASTHDGKSTASGDKESGNKTRRACWWKHI